MSIKPFVDRPEIDPGSRKTVKTSGKNGIDTSQIDSYRAGINVRSMSDFSQILSPVVTGRGLPANQNEKFDFGIEQNTFGQSKLFEDAGEDGKNTFFEDIGNLKNPVAYINANSRTALYPEVLLSPSWLDPAQLDGVLEPLTIRSKINNTSNEGPVVAHDIRGSLMPSSGPEISGKSFKVESFIQFEKNRGSSVSSYFDSQDSAMNIDGYYVSVPGYDDPEDNLISPFKEDMSPEKTLSWNGRSYLPESSIQIQFDQDFTGDSRLGTIGISSNTGFSYRGGHYRTKSTGTGNQKCLGTDSIAFGGLIKNA